MTMSFKIVAQNDDIPKKLLINQKIVNMDIFDNTTVLYLDNGCDLYIH